MPNINDINGVTIANLSKLDGVTKANIAKVLGLDVTAAAAFLLDTYTGATAAYSVRRLSSSSTVLVRVRRISTSGGNDNEADVQYDTNNEISLDSSISNASTGVSSTTLGEFVGASGYSNPDGVGSSTTARVTTWYDQASTNNATQTTNASQPEIYNGTSLVTINGTAAIRASELAGFATSLSSVSQAFTLTTVTSNNIDSYLLGSNNQLRYRNTTTSYWLGTDVDGGGTIPTNEQILSFGVGNGSSSFGQLYAQSAQPSGVTFTNSDTLNLSILGARYLGASTGNRAWLQEFVLWGSDQNGAGNTSGITTNINEEYLIYQPTDAPTSGLLATYTGAAAAYSVRQLSDKAVIAMRIRRDSDDEETNIGWDANGDLATADIAAFCGTANGYVTRWWDQSTNGNHADQATDASQPQIYNGTAVITLNGKPLVKATRGGGLAGGFIASFSLTQAFTVVSVGEVGNLNAHLYADSTRAYWMRPRNAGVSVNSGATLSTPGTFTHSGQIFNAYIADGVSSYVEATSAAGTEDNTGDSGSTDFSVATLLNRNTYDRAYAAQEAIFWNIDQGSTNIAAIETDMDTYYSFS